MTSTRQLPANFGPLKGADANARFTGPCGDTMEFWLQLDQNRIVRARFTTDGCGASIASGAMAASLAEGKTIGEALQIEPALVAQKLGGLPADHAHCPVLAITTLKTALDTFCSRHPEVDKTVPPTSEPTPEPAPVAPAAESAAEPVKPLSRIGLTLVVLSGKGGVGKSTMAVNLAVALAAAGQRVGLLDVDMHGPSIPTLLGIQERPATDPEAGEIIPIACGERLKAMSLGLLLKDSREAVIWRGPMKYNAIKELMGGVAWGELDVLVIDAPPGTGDEPLAVAQLARPPVMAIIVTTPQQVAVADVRRSLTFCSQVKLPVLGVIENMSGYACPQCGAVTALFKQGGGEALAAEMGVPFLGRIPLDPRIVDSSDSGVPFATAATPAAETLQAIAAQISSRFNAQPAPEPVQSLKTMKIAIPLVNGRLSEHFGHCEQFALIEVDPEMKTILSQRQATPPPHEPGVLPRWLQQQGTHIIIAGGMGGRALNLFKEYGIMVKTGVPGELPETMAQAYLKGELTAGVSACSHHGGGHDCQH